MLLSLIFILWKIKESGKSIILTTFRFSTNLRKLFDNSNNIGYAREFHSVSSEIIWKSNILAENISFQIVNMTTKT